MIKRSRHRGRIAGQQDTQVRYRRRMDEGDVHVIIKRNMRGKLAVACRRRDSPADGGQMGPG